MKPIRISLLISLFLLTPTLKAMETKSSSLQKQLTELSDFFDLIKQKAQYKLEIGGILNSQAHSHNQVALCPDEKHMALHVHDEEASKWARFSWIAPRETKVSLYDIETNEQTSQQNVKDVTDFLVGKTDQGGPITLQGCKHALSKYTFINTNPEAAIHAKSGMLAGADCWEIKFSDGTTDSILHKLTSCDPISEKYNDFKVTSLAFSPQAKYFVAALKSGDNKEYIIKLWDTTTKQCIRTWQAHPAEIRALAFDPSEKFLVSCSEDEDDWATKPTSIIKTWDLTKDNRCISTIKTDGRVCTLALNSAGTLLAWGAIGVNDSKKPCVIKLYDIKKESCIAEIPRKGGLEAGIETVAFSANDTYLATKTRKNLLLFNVALLLNHEKAILDNSKLKSLELIQLRKLLQRLGQYTVRDKEISLTAEETALLKYSLSGPLKPYARNFKPYLKSLNN